LRHRGLRPPTSLRQQIPLQPAAPQRAEVVTVESIRDGPSKTENRYRRCRDRRSIAPARVILRKWTRHCVPFLGSGPLNDVSKEIAGFSGLHVDHVPGLPHPNVAGWVCGWSRGLFSGVGGLHFSRGGSGACCHAATDAVVERRVVERFGAVVVCGVHPDSYFGYAWWCRPRWAGRIGCVGTVPVT
jgi:hypothetical protein